MQQPLQNLSHIKEMQGDRPKEVIDARAIGASAIVKGLAAVEALLVREHASASPRCATHNAAACCMHLACAMHAPCMRHA